MEGEPRVVVVTGETGVAVERFARAPALPLWALTVEVEAGELVLPEFELDIVGNPREGRDKDGAVVVTRWSVPLPGGVGRGGERSVPPRACTCVRKARDSHSSFFKTTSMFLCGLVFIEQEQ